MPKHKASRSSERQRGIIMASDRWIWPDGKVETFNDLDKRRSKRGNVPDFSQARKALEQMGFAG